MTWTFYLLSEHSDIRKKVLDEIRTNISPTGDISNSDLEKLELTSRVLQESMRLYPPAWVIERSSIGEDTIGGVKIPAGSMVSVCTYAVHRNPKYWEYPEKFDPDRFLPENMMILASILRVYEPLLAPGHKVEKEPLITLRPKYGMKMKLK